MKLRVHRPRRRTSLTSPDLAVISAAIIITRLQLVLRPRSRVIRGWIIVSSKLLLTSFHHNVLYRIINWPQQKASNATESWLRYSTMKERFLTFFHRQSRLHRYLRESTFPSNRPSIYSFHDFCSNPLVMPFVEVSIGKNEKRSRIEWRCIGFEI